MTDSNPTDQAAARAPYRTRLIALCGLVFLLLVVSGYYYLHKPLTPAVVGALLARLLDTLVAAGAMLTAVGLGRWLTSWGRGSSWGWWVLSLATGLAGLSLLWLALGAVGLYQGWAAWLVWLLGCATASSRLWRSRDALAGLWESIRPRSGLGFVVAGCLVLMAAGATLEALAPPVHFDALVYHLALPARYAQAGRIVPVPANPFSGSPQLGEMLYTWMTLLVGPSAAAVLGLFVSVAAVIGTVGVAAERLSKQAGWMAGGALVAGYTLWSTMGAAYVDWFAALFGLATVAALGLPSGRETGWRSLVLAGAVAGFATSVKWTAGAGLVAAVAVVLVRRRDWRGAGLVAAAAGLAVAPWLLKNLALTGAPLFPFGPGGLSPVRTAFFRQPPMAGAGWMAPVVPAAATVLGLDGAPGFATSIGPLLLGLLPGFLLLPAATRSRFVDVWLYLLVGWLVWAVASLSSVVLAQSRLYMVLFPAWAILAGAGFAGFRRAAFGQVRAGRLVAALAVLVLVLSAFSALRGALASGAARYDMGLMTDEAYLSERLGAYYPAAAEIRESYEAGQVVMLWEPRSLYCRPACLPDSWIDRWYASQRAGQTPDQIVGDWQRSGGTALLVHQAGLEFVHAHDARYGSADWTALDTLLASLQLEATFGDGYRLYRLSP